MYNYTNWHSQNHSVNDSTDILWLETLLSLGQITPQEARIRLGFVHPLLDDDMKHTIKNLERVLKEAFDESIVIGLFNKVDRIVELIWVPDNGPTEYGQYSYYDTTKTNIATRNKYPVSIDAWTKIFRVLELFFSQSDSALYLMRYSEWDGTIEHLFELYKTIRVRYDPIDKQWLSSMDNSLNVGPPLHVRNDDAILIAMCESITDNLLFEEYYNERKESNTEWNDLTNFHEWKKYKVTQ